MNMPGVAGYIAAWRPSSVPAEAACFARLVVTAAAPPGRDRAKNLLWAAGRLAGWAIPLGLEPVPQVLLHPSVIERFTAHAPGLSGAARRTLRTNLRFLARRVVPHLDAADEPLPREHAKAPYTPAEIAGYLALADAQPTMARRMRAAGLVCLGAGAGLIRSDLRCVRGTDICRRSGGVIVTVRAGRAPRAVPVLARYHDRLLASAVFAGGHLVTGGTSPGRHNISSPLTRSLAGGAGLPALDTSRLRATWLAETAGLIGLATFMHAAGITCSQRLGDITAGLDPGSEEQAVALPATLTPAPAAPGSRSPAPAPTAAWKTSFMSAAGASGAACGGGPRRCSPDPAGTSRPRCYRCSMRSAQPARPSPRSTGCETAAAPRSSPGSPQEPCRPLTRRSTLTPTAGQPISCGRRWWPAACCHRATKSSPAPSSG
jgi:hypothetical protein